jgi:hypothetical protein
MTPEWKLHLPPSPPTPHLGHKSPNSPLPYFHDFPELVFSGLGGDGCCVLSRRALRDGAHARGPHLQRRGGRPLRRGGHRALCVHAVVQAPRPSKSPPSNHPRIFFLITFRQPTTFYERELICVDVLVGLGWGDVWVRCGGVGLVGGGVLGCGVDWVARV